MSGKTVTVAATLGVVCIGTAAVYIANNEDKARKLGDAVLNGAEQVADAVIEGIPRWVEKTLIPAGRQLLADKGWITNS